MPLQLYDTAPTLSQAKLWLGQKDHQTLQWFVILPDPEAERDSEHELELWQAHRAACQQWNLSHRGVLVESRVSSRPIEFLKPKYLLHLHRHCY